MCIDMENEIVWKQTGQSENSHKTEFATITPLRKKNQQQQKRRNFTAYKSIKIQAHHEQIR